MSKISKHTSKRARIFAQKPTGNSQVSGHYGQWTMQGYVGLCMAMYVYVGLYRDMYGYVGLCRAMRGHVWLCRAIFSQQTFGGYFYSTQYFPLTAIHSVTSIKKSFHSSPKYSCLHCRLTYSSLNDHKFKLPNAPNPLRVNYSLSSCVINHFL